MSSVRLLSDEMAYIFISQIQLNLIKLKHREVFANF